MSSETQARATMSSETQARVIMLLQTQACMRLFVSSPKEEMITIIVHAPSESMPLVEN